jgi:trehalose 6-phosphate phosphatase
MNTGAVLSALVDRRAGRHLLLLFDFDGTLCPFDPDPDNVYLTATVTACLGSLARKAESTVGIISGRRLPDLHKRARVAPEIYLAGFHGLEIEAPGEAFMHPDAAAAAPLMREIAEGVRGHLPSLPGVFLEDKVFSIALHYREAGEPVRIAAQRQFLAAAEDHLSAGRLRLQPGACVLELLPGVAWNKGRALEWIRERVEQDSGPTFSVYVGDDVTDEDAFRAVGPHGMTVAASDRASGAEFQVDGPAEVERLLWLLDRGPD